MSLLGLKAPPEATARMVRRRSDSAAAHPEGVGLLEADKAAGIAATFDSGDVAFLTACRDAILRDDKFTAENKETIGFLYSSLGISESACGYEEVFDPFGPGGEGAAARAGGAGVAPPGGARAGGAGAAAPGGDDDDDDHDDIYEDIEKIDNGLVKSILEKQQNELRAIKSEIEPLVQYAVYTNPPVAQGKDALATGAKAFLKSFAVKAPFAVLDIFALGLAGALKDSVKKGIKKGGIKFSLDGNRWQRLQSAKIIIFYELLRKVKCKVRLQVKPELITFMVTPLVEMYHKGKIITDLRRAFNNADGEFIVTALNNFGAEGQFGGNKTKKNKTKKNKTKKNKTKKNKHTR